MKIHYSFYNIQKLEELKERKDPEAIKAVSKEMESLFAYELIKAMRQTTLASQNSFGNIYMSMFDMEIARLIAEKGSDFRI